MPSEDFLYTPEKRKEILNRPVPTPRTPQEIEAKLIEMMNAGIKERQERPSPSQWEERGREERSMVQAGLCFALGYTQLDYIERQLAKQEEARANANLESKI